MDSRKARRRVLTPGLDTASLGPIEELEFQVMNTIGEIAQLMVLALGKCAALLDARSRDPFYVRGHSESGARA